MIIELKQLVLENFKGIKSLSIDFDRTTNIYGRNKAGKTTLFDSFLWLLFGKDSFGSADFNIKTLDENGNAIPQIDHSVIGTLTVDGTEMVLQRVYKEKWTRRRGAEETELTGHETLFYINNVPLQAQEYKSRVSAMVDEGLFKLVTSSTAFSSLPWQKRREVLTQIAGKISDSDVVTGMSKVQAKDITAILNSGKPMDDFKKQVASTKKKLQDDLKMIPSRVDEVKRGIPEPINFEQVKNDIYAKQTALLEIEMAITDKVSAYDEQAKAIQAKRSEINTLKSKLQQIEFDVRSKAQAESNERTMKLNDLKQKGQVRVQSRKTMQEEMNRAIAAKSNAESKIKTLRDDWGKISEETLVFDPDKFICPTCKQSLPAETINTRKDIMSADFEANKTKRLSDIQAEGKQLKESVDGYDKDIEEYNKSIDLLTTEINTLADQYRTEEAESQITIVEILPVEYKQIEDQISVIELSCLDTPPLDFSGLKQQKGTIQSDIETMKYSLASEDQIKKGNARVKELLAEEKSIAQQISDLERQEFAMTAFEHGQMNLVESRINSKFSTVKFRLFNRLINGGIELCCDTLVGGVPISDANGAARVQAGLEIINVLSKHYNVYAPVWVDNSEMVNIMPEMESQRICLYVSMDESLTIK